jgi:hypothetical protein
MSEDVAPELQLLMRNYFRRDREVVVREVFLLQQSAKLPLRMESHLAGSKVKGQTRGFPQGQL